MIASFYYILIQNPQWNKFIYIYLVSLQKKKTTQVNAKYEGKKTRKKTVIKQLKTKMKLYFALCFTVTDCIHTYHTVRPDTQFKVG